MKKIKRMNTVIGAPVQVALIKNRSDVSLYLWQISNIQTKIEIAQMQDSFGMIPISAAIVYNCEELVNILLNCEKYELMKPDLQNRTPFSYACQVNQIQWMNIIFSRINLQNANLVDKIGNSALTYVACNNNVEFCNFMFVNDIEVFNINADYNGIIESYQKAINIFNKLKKIAQQNYDQARLNYEKWDKEISYWSSRICFINLRILSLEIDSNKNPLSLIELVAERAALINAQNKKNEAINNRTIAERITSKYRERLQRINALKRKDLLSNCRIAINLATHDNDMNFLTENNLNVTSLVCSLSQISSKINLII